MEKIVAILHKNERYLAVNFKHLASRKPLIAMHLTYLRPYTGNLNFAIILQNWDKIFNYVVAGFRKTKRDN